MLDIKAADALVARQAAHVRDTRPVSRRYSVRPAVLPSAVIDEIRRAAATCRIDRGDPRRSGGSSSCSALARSDRWRRARDVPLREHARAGGHDAHSGAERPRVAAADRLAVALAIAVAIACGRVRIAKRRDEPERVAIGIRVARWLAVAKRERLAERERISRCERVGERTRR